MASGRIVALVVLVFALLYALVVAAMGVPVLPWAVLVLIAGAAAAVLLPH